LDGILLASVSNAGRSEMQDKTPQEQYNESIGAAKTLLAQLKEQHQSTATKLAAQRKSSQNLTSSHSLLRQSFIIEHKHGPLFDYQQQSAQNEVTYLTIHATFLSSLSRMLETAITQIENSNIDLNSPKAVTIAQQLNNIILIIKPPEAPFIASKKIPGIALVGIGSSLTASALLTGAIISKLLTAGVITAVSAAVPPILLAIIVVGIVALVAGGALWWWGCHNDSKPSTQKEVEEKVAQAVTNLTTTLNSDDNSLNIAQAAIPTALNCQPSPIAQPAKKQEHQNSTAQHNWNWCNLL